MGLFGLDLVGEGLKLGLDGVTGGASRLLGEDTLARIPVVGGITGSKTDSQKALLKKQEEMAADARKRQQQMEQARLNALGQKLLAFNPQNQMMAQMYGPEAAFQPSQIAQMAQNPMPQQAWGTGTDEERINQVKAREQEERRKAMLMGGIQQPGPGPAPLQPRTPQPARRF